MRMSLLLQLYDDDSKLPVESKQYFIGYLFIITILDRLKERLDFMLREGLVENSYLNAITAHNSYWTSADTTMYLLLQLYSYQKEQ